MQDLFTNNALSVEDSRILYTPSEFARTNLLHIQEVGFLRAVKPHTSKREKLQSYLCFAVEEGKGELVYEGKRYELKQGDVVFIDCKKSYSHSTGYRRASSERKSDMGDEGGDLWTLKWCHFYGPSMPAIYAKYCERGGEPVIRTAELSGVPYGEDADTGEQTGLYTALLSELYDLASSPDYIRDMRINEKLNALLTLLMKSSRYREKGGNMPAPKKTELPQVKAFIDEHYAEKLSLKSVAGSFFIDKYYLARLFKERYGVTVTAYLQQVRITHAKRMLRFTDMKIEDIASECGLGEPNYFSRVFKKIEGMSPSEFRKRW